MLDMKVLEEYFRIYSPCEDANTCCFLCKKNIDGCSWANSFEPVEGWKAIKAEKRTSGSIQGYKIFYCPEFEEGDSAEGREYDEDGCMRLLETIYRTAANDYKSAYKRKLKAERVNSSLSKSEIQAAETMMNSSAHLLGKWTEKLEQIVEEEMALEEGDADG